eukprot:1354054-Rhodomonas_salina.1
MRDAPAGARSDADVGLGARGSQDTNETGTECPVLKSAMGLRARYGVSGTEGAYGATRLRSSASRLWPARYCTPRSAYGSSVRRPVQTQRTARWLPTGLLGDVRY